MGRSKAQPIYLLSPSARDGVFHLPMIQFAVSAKRIDFSCCDTLLFSSKQAARTAEKIDPNWKKYPCIAIGGATKKEIESLGGEVIYYPKHFYADELAQDIAEQFADKKILYLRPRKISFDSKGFLAKKGISLKEQVIYETSCVQYMPDDAPPQDSIIIFTSPSSIHCFVKNFLWDSSYIAIVIGRATKVHLPKEAKYEVSDKPLIDACIAKAKEVQSY